MNGIEIACEWELNGNKNQNGMEMEQGWERNNNGKQ